MGFFRAIHTNTNAIEDGQLVYVADSNHNRLGFGHFHHGSIAIKMLHFGKDDYREEFWEQQLSKALKTRKNLFFQINRPTVIDGFMVKEINCPV